MDGYGIGIRNGDRYGGKEHGEANERNRMEGD